MSKIDASTSAQQAISVGEPMPRLASVAHHGAYEITVEWVAGSTADVVDLAPLVLTHKLYKPLRDNPDLLKTVHMIEDGSAIAWGADDAIDMAATSIERLAEEQMSPADFRAWLEQSKLTYDAAAAQLGISRRLIAYYANQRRVPRYIALACRYLDAEAFRPLCVGGVSAFAVEGALYPPPPVLRERGPAAEAVDHLPPGPAWENRPKIGINKERTRTGKGINKERTKIGKAKGTRGQLTGKIAGVRTGKGKAPAISGGTTMGSPETPSRTELNISKRRLQRAVKRPRR
jgi:hypothetical protein